jgi:hypothetical protein
MYCPRCGREMSTIDGTFTCIAGRMPFSPRMNEAMSQRFPVARGGETATEIGARIARWYCPGCGVPLNSEMACPKCHKSIRDKLVELVELHPRFG